MRLTDHDHLAAAHVCSDARLPLKRLLHAIRVDYQVGVYLRLEVSLLPHPLPPRTGRDASQSQSYSQHYIRPYCHYYPLRRSYT